MSLRIEIVYIFPAGPHYLQLAWRFLNSYHQHPPQLAHDTVLVCNGWSPDESLELFKTLPNMRTLQHDNSGYDIGGYQAAAQSSNADMQVFLAASAYCRKTGWLVRMASAFEQLGSANLYGSCGNLGDGAVQPHLRTTGFWCSPVLMNRYPHRVTRPDQRYPFEHGLNCFTGWVRNQGLRVFVVDWEGTWEYPQWNDSPNGFHRGSQSALLVGDRLTEPPYYPSA